MLCTSITSDFLRFEWSDYDFGTGNHAASGECLDLYTVTPADWYTYINRWTLCDDGSLFVSIGASGTLAPHLAGNASDGAPLGDGNTQYAVDHYHNVFWRLEFGLGGAADIVSQTDVAADGARRSEISQDFKGEASATTAPGRGWNVRAAKAENSDSHPLSYDIDLMNRDPYRGVPGHAFTDSDFYVTQYHPCEELAAQNVEPGCSQSVDKYVSGENVSRPVVWLQTSFHHVPRDEDEPIMDEHWQGFDLMPRGLTATNQMIPPAD